MRGILRSVLSHFMFWRDPSLFIGKSKKESSAFADFRCKPDAAVMMFNDLFADGQTYAAAAVLIAVIEPLKQLENAVAVLFLDADAVVVYGKKPTLFGLFG